MIFVSVFSSLYNFDMVSNKKTWNIGHAFYIKHLCGFVVSNQDFKDYYVRGRIKRKKTVQPGSIQSA